MRIVELLLLIRVLSNAPRIQLTQLLGYTARDGGVVFGLESIFEALENPPASGFEVEHTVQVREVVSHGRLVLVVLRNLLLVLLHLLLHFVHHRVVNGLIGFLVGEAEPSSVDLTFLKAFSTRVEFLDRQQYHGAWLLDGAQRYLDFLVIIYLEHGVPNII